VIDARVRILLELGASVNAIDDVIKRPALFEAAKWGHESVVKLLISFGANVNFCSKKNGSILQIALTCGHQNIVDILLEAGAKLERMERMDLVWQGTIGLRDIYRN
jgi:ankyrin repeat protein